MMFRKRPSLIISVPVLLTVVLGVIFVTRSNIDATTLFTNGPPAHNHPISYYTDGTHAISSHSERTLLTIADVQRYVYSHQFPGGPVVPGAHLQIVVLQLMTSREASVEMRGEYIGLPDSAPVYYVAVKGPFIARGLLVPTGSESIFNEGEEAFDAQTGFLLVWGIRG